MTPTRSSRRLLYPCVTALALLLGCSSVSIQATRNPKYPGAILLPVAVVIFEGNTGPDYTLPLKGYLLREFQKRRMKLHVEVITGAEFNEDEVIGGLAQAANGLILIIPGGGTSYGGSLTQILYDVRVLLITKRPEVEVATVWRAKVDTTSGAYDFQIDARIEKFAEDLVRALINDRVVARPTK